MMQRVTANGSNQQDPEQRQRRTSARRASALAVRLLTPREGSGFALNVSAGGVRVAVDCALVAGELVQVRFVEANETSRLETLRVVWSRALPDGWIAGLERTGMH